MKIIVGNTGLIGKTITENETFDYSFNSKNISEYRDIVKNGDELFLSCLPATKWLVNQNINEDILNINKLINTFSYVSYSKITLISTIDIYNDSPLCVNENYHPNVSKFSYGNNRYFFELLVKQTLKYDDLKIFRLPALFGKHIKKNILFDLLTNNNVDKINADTTYQWYNLEHLSTDIKRYCDYYSSKTEFNFFTEPLHTSFILNLFPEHKNTVQENLNNSVTYDYKTIYGDTNGYMYNKKLILNDIKKFVYDFRSQSLCI